MTNYSAITIGPIGHTLSLARKPREFWAASFLFSYLMKSIMEDLKSKKITIISPAEPNPNLKLGVGLYPDRVFFEGGEDYKFDIATFCGNLGISGAEEYFKVLVANGEYASESEAIKKLNKQLDGLELTNYAFTVEAEKEIRDLIATKACQKKLIDIAFENGMPYESLGEICACTLKNHHRYKSFKDELLVERIGVSPYSFFEKELVKSYHKYFCIVQADGDNMGKTIQNGNVAAISTALIQYAAAAVPKISDYGAMPIYAGGEDLLFIAPVVGKDGKNIFDLIGEIDDIFAKHFEKMEGNPSLSYGISITYYKFPLYEAWKKASNLLFGKAKKVEGKNAVAWELQKHSGSTFTGALSKSDAAYGCFKKLLGESQPETVVSAVSHKLRENDMVLNIIKASDNPNERTDAFFKKIIGMSEAEDYKDCVRDLLKALYEVNEIKNSHHPNDKDAKDDEKKEDLSLLAKYIYGMLRTAKFINGEEER